MNIYRLPEHLKTIIFDIDGTLYTNQSYVMEQVDVQIRHWAKLNKMTEKEARDRIADYRKEWSQKHEGKKISLGNTFLAFGIDIDTSIEWRNSILEPEKYLSRDKKLQEALKELSKHFALIAVTNNPVLAAQKTLKALGADTVITQIVGLDTCKKSKPAKENLECACRMTGAAFSECLSIGDRYDIDLALPLEMGMGAILVNGAEDIYKLPQILL